MSFRHALRLRYGSRLWIKTETNIDFLPPEKEVRKANRELHSQTAKMDVAQKIDHLSRRCTELLHDMKRHERESSKNKKRADQLQKDRDQSRTDLSKATTLKEKLEKLCRELQKENNKLKVGSPPASMTHV